MIRETSDLAQRMDGLIDRVEELHSSPVVACKVLNVLKDPDFEVQEVERHLEADPALAAAILRLVNSSCFGLARKIGSLHQAVTLLGARSLRLAVLSFGLVDRLTRGTPVKVCTDYWRRALSMASAASRLCINRGMSSPDEAYSAGLLADAGVLVFAQADTESYVSLYEEHGHGEDLVEAERSRFGFDHSALGARLLSRWNLPEPLTRAVARHHADCRDAGLLDLAVWAGDVLADVLWTPQAPRLAEARRFLTSEFDLDLDGFVALVTDCKNDISANAELFHVELTGSIDCVALLEQALRQYKEEAMGTAMDWDSLAAISDQGPRRPEPVLQPEGPESP